MNIVKKVNFLGGGYQRGGGRVVLHYSDRPQP